MIRLRSIAVAEPPFKFDQKEALSFILKNFEMRAGTRALYEKVFANESIEQRRFAVRNGEDFLEQDPDLINRQYESRAVKLSSESLALALGKAEIGVSELKFLSSSTCTGYLCPGLSTRLIESCSLRSDLRTVDIVGMGCGSAVPSLEQCYNFLSVHPEAKAASVSTEICSSAIYSDDAPELVISNAIFADGSGSCVLENSDDARYPALRGFSSITHPEWREALKFTTEGGRLRNVLDKKVPDLAGQAVRELTQKILSEFSLKPLDIGLWIFHAGGGKVLNEIQKAVELSDFQMSPSRSTLRRYGNLSSASVLYSLHDCLSGAPLPKGSKALIAAFGAGFSAHACLFEF